jgi:4-hydroxy-3-polyprenylbenzoate decarboxylase
MAYASFSQFLEALEKAGELQRISTPVETDLVIAEWADREMKSPRGGKALLFEQPLIDGKVSKFPVAINTMGSEKRMALALQRDSIADIAQEIQLILKAKPPTDLREGWSLLKQGVQLLHARPKHVKSAPCQEVIHRFAERSTSNAQRPTFQLGRNRAARMATGSFANFERSKLNVRREAPLLKRRPCPASSG